MPSESEKTSLLEGLGAEREQVKADTWHHEPEMMALLEEAHNLYWECFSLLAGHHITDDAQRALIYLAAAAFHSLQSAFMLIESGYYGQAAVVIRLLINEYLVSNLARHDPEFAATFLSGSDWARVRQLAADLLNRANGLEDCPQYLVSFLSTGIDQRLSFQAYVALDELRHSKEVPKQFKKRLTPLCKELQKDRVRGLTALLRELERLGLSAEKILQYRSDLELLGRHAHGAGMIVKADVVARDEEGGQWMVPRYERDRCRYCGYRAAIWSSAVLGCLTGHFQSLSGEDSWTERLAAFHDDVLNWGRKTHLVLEASPD